MKPALSRLGIFVFFDPQGIVDDYVLYLLRSFRPHFQRLLVISNGPLDQTARERLLQYTDDLRVRENRGLDAAAYKEGLISFCGWEEVSQYDEVVLMNDTFFGPIHPFDDMFLEMSARDVDFWGMSAGYHAIDGWNRVKYGYIPDHIQTFFVAFRKKMVCTEAFRSYWQTYDDSLNDFESVVTQHEVIMTRHFQDLGFRWDIYADTQAYNSKQSSENFNLHLYHPHAMLRDMNFPVLKKKALAVDLNRQLAMGDLEDSADALRYVHNETGYDTRLIWEHLLRRYNIADLYHSLHLTHVFPSVPADLPEGTRAALVLRMSNPFFADRICSHACRISTLMDVYLIPETEGMSATVQQRTLGISNIHILKPSHQKTEMGAFVLCCKELADQYDYLGFLSDIENPDLSSVTIAESTLYGYLQNIAGGTAYLSQILRCFTENPRLGVLAAPFPVHDYGFGNYGNAWGNCLQTLKALSEELNIRCSISEEKPPFMLSGAFWCRTVAIGSIWNKTWEARHFSVNPVTNCSKTNEALIRLLPYAAQSEGYYSGTVMHTNYASIRLTNQQYMLDQIISATKQQLGCQSGRYLEYIQQLQSIQQNTQDSPLTIDLSRFGIGAILRIFLERKAPPWLTRSIYKFYRLVKNNRSKS